MCSSQFWLYRKVSHLFKCRNDQYVTLWVRQTKMKNRARMTGHEPRRYQLNLAVYSTLDTQKWLFSDRGSHICSLICVSSVLSVTWRNAGALSTDC